MMRGHALLHEMPHRTDTEQTVGHNMKLNISLEPLVRVAVTLKLSRTFILGLW
jgi:hypothetical protein